MEKVLIIEDEIDICLLLKSHLRKHDFEANYELSLARGLKTLQDTHPDILILDNNLGDGLGIEHLPVIKSKYPKLKIIMISAMSMLKNTALAAGVHHFLKKPFSMNTLDKLLAHHEN